MQRREIRQEEWRTGPRDPRCRRRRRPRKASQCWKEEGGREENNFPMDNLAFEVVGGGRLPFAYGE